MKLTHKLTYDLLFKMYFVKYPHLLKSFVTSLLGIDIKKITKFDITNPEIPPDSINGKFCVLDLSMKINNLRCTLEIQVQNKGNYRERSLFIWAKEFSRWIVKGEDYKSLPRTILISVLGYNQFKKSKKYHSKFAAMEVNLHTKLSDKLDIHFFELKKLPKSININSNKELWLLLFNAKTEKDLNYIESLEVPLMTEAVQAYREVSASDEFNNLEWMRQKASLDEAQAIRYHSERAARRAARQAKKQSDDKWKVITNVITAEKDASIAEKDASIAKKDADLADASAEIIFLRQQLAQLTKSDV